MTMPNIEPVASRYKILNDDSELSLLFAHETKWSFGSKEYGEYEIRVANNRKYLSPNDVSKHNFTIVEWLFTEAQLTEYGNERHEAGKAVYEQLKDMTRQRDEAMNGLRGIKDRAFDVLNQSHTLYYEGLKNIMERAGVAIKEASK